MRSIEVNAEVGRDSGWFSFESYDETNELTRKKDQTYIV